MPSNAILRHQSLCCSRSWADCIGNRAEGRARRKGGYTYAGSADPNAAADDELIRERATRAREFDHDEIKRGGHTETLPPFRLAALPLLVVVLTNLFISFVVLPRMDATFLNDERCGATSFVAVGGVWSVIVALATAILVLVTTNYRRLPSLRTTMDAGANASVLPILSVASLVGFGAVVVGLPAFEVVKN